MRRLSARVAANRRNARKSTGPTSAPGKARSAQNALRHGLAVSAATAPDLAAPIEDLARYIAGPDASAARLALARVLAQSEIDLVRTRQARLALLMDPRARVTGPSADDMLRGLRALGHLLPKLARGVLSESPPPLNDADSARLSQVDRLNARLELAQSPPDLIDALPVVLPKLLRLDRYDQRARSRRHKALVGFRAALDAEGAMMEGE